MQFRKKIQNFFSVSSKVRNQHKKTLITHLLKNIKFLTYKLTRLLLFITQK